MRSVRPALACALTLASVGLSCLAASACTSVLVTPGASSDGSSFVTHTADSGYSAYEISKVPARDWPLGSTVDVPDLPQYTGGRQLAEVAGGPTGRCVPQVPHTYGYIKGLFGMVNDKQVAIGETTFGGRPELANSRGWFQITDLSMMAMERAATAREAITVMGELAVRYGYRDSGEELSIADPRECWVFEIVGPGPSWCEGSGEPGAFWVAQRLPDGHVAASANAAVIREIRWDDHENFLYSPGILDYAVRRGWYDPAGGCEFSWRRDFCDAEQPEVAGRRVWRVMSLVAPSLEGCLDEKDLPFSVPAERKLTFSDLAAINRDHYEGTRFYGGDSLTAGPWNNPRRYGGLTFRVGADVYSWQRSIAQVGCEYSIIVQLRHWLPDPIGAVLWYGAANPDTTCYVPFYAGVSRISETMNERAGSHLRFTRESYWWAISAVSTYADLKWSYMSVDIARAQDVYEGGALAAQPSVEAEALRLYGRDPHLAAEFLTHYCNSNVERVRDAWWALLDTLIWKYNAGFVVEGGTITSPGYPEPWLTRVIRQNEPDHFRSDQSEK